MGMHNQLGGGFLELVDKDVLQYKFKKAGIFFERDKEYKVQ